MSAHDRESGSDFDLEPLSLKVVQARKGTDSLLRTQNDDDFGPPFNPDLSHQRLLFKHSDVSPFRAIDSPKEKPFSVTPGPHKDRRARSGMQIERDAEADRHTKGQGIDTDGMAGMSGN
mmetsp:Transcript_15685/g.34669  ORF Transcript_15685/g.34669 Transcript_15685/m.34669 type:complete len:119 (+) Transcript_15685:93-449(+)